MSDRGLLIVISGPSGAGKGTICANIRKEMPNLVYSVSMTTRAPRVGEKEGINYFFRSKEEFESLLSEDAFLEYAKVYDNYYGTPKQHVMDLLDDGKSVLLEIDIQGAMQVKERFSDAVFIYRRHYLSYLNVYIIVAQMLKKSLINDCHWLVQNWP